MYVIEMIREHINRLPMEVLFTTRDLLNYGPRPAIDNSIYSLVRSGEIVRIARGVFASSKRTTEVSTLEVATVKAKSFGRTIISHARDVAWQLGLVDPLDKNLQPTFATNGRTSRFRFGAITIHFKGTSPRKMSLGDSRTGQTIRALCHIGKERISLENVEAAIENLSADERTRAGNLCAFMPAWLSNFFYEFYRPAHSIILLEYENLESKDHHVREKLRQYLFSAAFRQPVRAKPAPS